MPTATDSQKPAKVLKYPPPRVVDADFARRLNKACVDNPNCPTDGRGRQKWLKDALKAKYDVTVSHETASKWFSGKARPRPKVMVQIAAVLEVDLPWLSIGTAAAETPVEARRRKATATGAENLVAGLLQLAGGNVAFADDDEDVDLFAVYRGERLDIEVQQPISDEDNMLRFRVSKTAPSHVVIAVVSRPNTTEFELLRLTTSLIETYGAPKSRFLEFVAERVGRHYYLGDDPVPEITSFSMIGGTLPPRRTKATRKATDTE